METHWLTRFPLLTCWAGFNADLFLFHSNLLAGDYKSVIIILIMDKKVILIIIGVILVVIVVSVYGYNFFKLPDLSNQISGQIKEVKNGMIVIEGLIKSSKPGSNRSEKKTIEFKVTPDTIFKKTEFTMPKGTKPGEPFVPLATETQGNISDLSFGVRIIRLQSKENLFKTDKATATEIHYAIYKLF